MLASVGSVPFIVVLIVFVPSPSGSYICFLFLLPVLPDIFFHDHYPLLRAIVAALWAFALAPPASSSSGSYRRWGFLKDLLHGIESDSGRHERAPPASAQEEAFPGGVARPRGADVLGAHAPVRVPARRRREAGDAEVGSARTGVHVACRGGGATPGAPRSSTHARLYEACRAGPDEMRAAHIATLI